MNEKLVPKNELIVLERAKDKVNLKAFTVIGGETYRLRYSVKGEENANTVSGYHVFRVYAVLARSWKRFGTI